MEQLLDEYKGFRCRKSPDKRDGKEVSYCNVFYVDEQTGIEYCNGQTYPKEFRDTVESLIRYPIQVGERWASGEKYFSPYRDEEKCKNTCAHLIPLSSYCYECHASYGNARVV